MPLVQKRYYIIRLSSYQRLSSTVITLRTKNYYIIGRYYIIFFYTHRKRNCVVIVQNFHDGASLGCRGTLKKWYGCGGSAPWGKRTSIIHWPGEKNQISRTRKTFVWIEKLMSRLHEHITFISLMYTIFLWWGSTHKKILQYLKQFWSVIVHQLQVSKN